MSIQAKIAQTITETCYRHRVYASVLPRDPRTKEKYLVKTPATVIFPIYRTPGTRIADVIALRRELADEIGKLTRTPDISIRFGDSPFHVEVPRKTTDLLGYDQTPLASLQPFQFLLGRSWAFGQPNDHIGDITDSNSAQMMFAGRNGSGKSVALLGACMSLAYSTSPDDLIMLAVDLKNRSLHGLRQLPHLRYFATEEAEARQVLHYAFAEMMRRKREHLPPEPRIVVAIDEFRELLYADNIILDEYVPRIVSLGRSLGVHIWGATQKPLASELGSVVQSQWNIKVVGALSTGRESSAITGHEKAEAHLLPGKGAMLLVRDGTRPIRVQSFYVDENAPDAAVSPVIERWGAPGDDYMDLGDMDEYENDTPAYTADQLAYFERWYDWDAGKFAHGTRSGWQALFVNHAESKAAEQALVEAYETGAMDDVVENESE